MLLEPLRLVQTLALVLEFLETVIPEREKPEQGVFLEQLTLTIGLEPDMELHTQIRVSYIHFGSEMITYPVKPLTVTPLMVKEASSLPLQ